MMSVLEYINNKECLFTLQWAMFPRVFSYQTFFLHKSPLVMFKNALEF